MVCYSCGEYIGARDTYYTECPGCFAYYCTACSKGIHSCSACSAPLVAVIGIKSEYLDPSDAIDDIIAAEKRRHHRIDFELDCTFIVKQESRPYHDQTEYKALTRNISKSGLCIYSPVPLQVDKEVLFEGCSAVPGSAEAIVRWVKQENYYLYVAGLEFESKEREEGAKPDVEP